MRVAILADIHGNLPAFEAALDHVAKQHVDRLIIAGDIVVGSPDSAACWRLAQALGCPILRGNHERYVAHYGAPGAPPEWATERFAPVRWAYSQLAEEERRAIEALPLAIRPPDLPDLLVVHASIRADRDSVMPYTPEEQLAAMFPQVQERWIVRAHNHTGQVRLWEERTIITAGAVGLPLDCNPTAQYVLLERRNPDGRNGAGGWRIQHQSVPYDLDATLRRFRESGYLDAAGPMARLLQREVATASFYIVPFLNVYGERLDRGEIALDAAVQRFLTTD
jgi:3',5'-cyclic AMP phosphodiesterase CpdA